MNLNFKNVGFCSSSPNKKLELGISAEIGEKTRRKTEPKREFLKCCRVLLQVIFRPTEVVDVTAKHFTYSY